MLNEHDQNATANGSELVVTPETRLESVQVAKLGLDERQDQVLGWKSFRVPLAAVPVSVTNGATVGLGGFEFARPNLTVRAFCLEATQADWTEWAMKTIDELLAREKASIKREAHSPEALADPPCCWGLKLSVDYGMTRKMNPRDFGKVDVSQSGIAGEGESFEDLYLRVSGQAERRLAEMGEQLEVRLNGQKSDTGL